MYKDIEYSLYGGVPKKYKQIRNKVFKDWEIPPWDLVIDSNHLIGEGKYGKVYLASWRETDVVAKVMGDNIDIKTKKLFINEFDTLSKAHHPNVVQLLGYIEDPFIIVMEYLPCNNLLYYINNKKLILIEKINVCLDILKGVEYLHSRKPQSIIHRDIKPQNIILNETKKAKIGDFGLSKLFSSHELKKSISTETLENLDTEMTNPVGTKRYMSPEIITEGGYNHKIDIWALGIMFSELFENKRHDKSFYWSKTPENIKNIIIQYMLRNDPKDRLSALEIIHQFQYIKQQVSNENKYYFSCLCC